MKHLSKRLYSKFKNRAIKTLESDEFYEHFMKVVDSGVRFYGQKNEGIIKKIDETWVNALYEAIPSLDIIINKPRMVIEREEVIVPVELARKVGADSVKHLSTHTQYINKVDDDGSVIPSKIMNIYCEESFAIYENRFVMTLLQRVCGFVDQRYDNIMDALGEEFRSALKVEASFSDKGEKVDYNLSFNLHQGHDYFDSKKENIDVVQRIEHIRLMYNSFKRSEFYQKLMGCTLVKPPISRTNLMMKNPHFKKCYDLWNFLEKYHYPGFIIEKREIDEDFSDEYVSELNVMILFNYLIMKNNLETENNRPAEINKKKLRVVKPKFKKKNIGEKPSDDDTEQPELKETPEIKITQNFSGVKSREEMILSILFKFLREEQIINYIEKSLKLEVYKKETKENEKARKEELVQMILQKIFEEEVINVKQNA